MLKINWILRGGFNVLGKRLMIAWNGRYGAQRLSAAMHATRRFCFGGQGWPYTNPKALFFILLGDSLLPIQNIMFNQKLTVMGLI